MIKTINVLKSLFGTGDQATEDSFADLIDSSYNKAEDSVLLGPIGLTGTYGLIAPPGGTYYGLIGPRGGTYIGLYISATGSTTISPGTTGSKGEIIIAPNGANDVYLYIHNGIQWMRFLGTDDW